VKFGTTEISASKRPGGLINQGGCGFWGFGGLGGDFEVKISDRKALTGKAITLRPPKVAGFFQKSYFSGCVGMGPILFWVPL
jgi:hypothetical protein